MIVLKAQSKSGQSRRNVMLKSITVKRGKTGRAFNIANKATATFLLDKSRLIVPIDEKDLYNSSRVVGKGRGFDNVQEVSYNMPYALMQHENLSYKHKPGKSAKYLEKPSRQYRREMQMVMRDKLAQHTAGGKR